MSPTSYQLLHPAMSTRWRYQRDVKDTLNFHFTKSKFHRNSFLRGPYLCALTTRQQRDHNGN